MTAGAARPAPAHRSLRTPSTAPQLRRRMPPRRPMIDDCRLMFFVTVWRGPGRCRRALSGSPGAGLPPAPTTSDTFHRPLAPHSSTYFLRQRRRRGGPKHTRRKRQVSGIIEHLSPECDVSCGAPDYVNELYRLGSHAHDSGGPHLQFGRNFGKIPGFAPVRTPVIPHLGGDRSRSAGPTVDARGARITWAIAAKTHRGGTSHAQTSGTAIL